MGMWGNGYLGKIYIWWNWAPGEMGIGANRPQGKWTFGEKEYPKCPVFIFPKCLQMGTGANGHLGQMDIWEKGVPQVPYVHLSRCSFASNSHLPQVPNCLGPKCLGSNCAGLKCAGPNYLGPFVLVPICLWSKCTSPNCPKPICLVPIYPGARLSWCPSVRVSNVQKSPATPHTSIWLPASFCKSVWLSPDRAI